MKYLNYYDSYNENNKNSIQITNTLNNLLSTLGLKCKSGQTSLGTSTVYQKSLDSYTTYFELNLNLGEIKNGIISIIINAMLDTNNCEYDIYPSFEGFNTNFAIVKEINILINPSEFSETFLTKKILSTSNEEIYKKILLKIIEIFEKAKPEYTINAKNGIFPKALEKNIFDLNFINELIIKYLTILAYKPYNKKSNNDFKDLYKLTYNAICQSTDNFKIFNNIYINNPKLFSSLKEFGKINLEIGKEMGELGF